MFPLVAWRLWPDADEIEHTEELAHLGRLSKWVVGSLLLLLFLATLIHTVVAVRLNAEIKRAASQAIESHWRILVHPELDLARLYALNEPVALENLALWRSMTQQHYLEPAARAGLRFLSISVDLDVESIEVTEDRAIVMGLLKLEYETQQQGEQPVMTRETGIPCTVVLVRCDNAWLLLGVELRNIFWPPGEIGHSPVRRGHVGHITRAVG
jgi:hypothetical protein